MTAAVLNYLAVIAAVAVAAYIIGKWRGELRSRLLESEVRRLKGEFRIRQLWGDQRRYELATLLRIYFVNKYPSGGRRELLEKELARQAKLCGLTMTGSAAAGFAPTRDLTDGEYRELAELTRFVL